VLLFQKDLIPSRALGLLRMADEAGRLVDGLRGTDRAAVLSFDSHLRLWSDFTGDRTVLRRALVRGVLFGERPVGGHAVAGEPRLSARLAPEAARAAAGIETALRLLGEALAPLEGSKSVVLFGWGLGRLGPTGVRMEPDYEPARRALQRARATVFSLDVTDADRHSLEVGLQQVASDTGGFYARTHDFPAQALRRLRGALAGHYVLELERPDLPRGEHRLKVSLRHGRGTLLARSSYLD
jgi:VWFA-related protein